MAFSNRTPSSPHYDISHILRPSERVSVSLPCRTRTDGLEYHQAEAAIIFNAAKVKEAAVIVVVPSATTQDIRILHLIPIDDTFQHSLNQTPPSPSTSFFHQSSRPHITLTLWNEDTKAELRISSALTQRVQSVTKEFRRLSEQTNQQSSTVKLPYPWIGLYPIQPPSFRLSNNWDDDDDEIAPGASSSRLSASPSSVKNQIINTSLSDLTLSTTTKDEEESPNPFAPTFSRTTFLREKLFTRQAQWSKRDKAKIRLATYNVNDKLPPPGTTELAPMVGQGEEDLLVFGFQEVDLRSQALLISQGNVRAEEWEAAILKALKEKAAEYERIALTQYVGVVTIVFAKRSVREHITRIETSERGIGLLGFGGNKAGVCVRLKIYDSTLSFVNSHLAAFATALERRRQDYQTLLTGLTFQRPTSEGNPVFEEFLPENRDKLLGVEDSHILFWLGDLNYRVDVEDDILRAWVVEGKWKSILEKDQLLADISAGKSFGGYQEGPIDFPPSFKYVHGSSTLDAKRSPAYTDRIIYSVPGPSKKYSSVPKIDCDSYTSHEIFWSDHRPVSASFSVDVRVVDEDKRREEFVAAERALEKLEELYKPSLEFSTTNVEFGDIRLRQQAVQEVVLKNKGKVPASFAFKTPSADRQSCKVYYWPVPSFGTIPPETDLTLRISLHVNETSAKRLTVGEDDLNDVLVLQVADGKDTFITLQATFLPSILSLPLTQLSLFSEPIRSIPLSKRKEVALPKEQDPYEGQKGSKPVKEVWRLLEYLMASAPCPKDLWTATTSHRDVLDILESLDSGIDLPKGKEKEVASTLVFLLSCLPDSLVGSKIKECEAVKSRDEAYAALEGLEQVNTNVLIGLMSVVRLCAGVEPTPVASEPVTLVTEQNEQNKVEEPTVSPSIEAEDIQATTTDDEDADEADLVVYSAEDTNVNETVKQGNDEGDRSKPSEEVTESATASPVMKEAMPPPEIKSIDDKTVAVLVQAVFGRARGQAEGQKRFIRCMLDG